MEASSRPSGSGGPDVVAARSSAVTNAATAEFEQACSENPSHNERQQAQMDAYVCANARGTQEWQKLQVEAGTLAETEIRRSRAMNFQ